MITNINIIKQTTYIVLRIDFNWDKYVYSYKWRSKRKKGQESQDHGSPLYKAYQKVVPAKTIVKLYGNIKEKLRNLRIKFGK